MNVKLLLCALGLAVAGTSTANATLITKHWGFEAETSGPISRHEGYFSYQYDTETQEASLTAIDFALGDHAFSLDDVLFDIDSGFVLLGGKSIISTASRPTRTTFTSFSCLVRSLLHSGTPKPAGLATDRDLLL